MKRMLRDLGNPQYHPIGVIDLLDGHAVRGLAGKRSEYRRLDCNLTKSGNSLELARNYREFGIREIYIADLDAITTGVPQTELLTQFSQFSSCIYIDAGIGSKKKLAEFQHFFSGVEPLIVFVVGLESLHSAAELREMLCGENVSLAFSLDLQSGQPLGNVPEWNHLKPMEIVDQVVELGVKRLIILDLAAVGTSQGCPTLSLCRSTRDRHPQIELITGGGVRDTTELRKLAQVCDGVLLGSLLYDRPEDVAQALRDWEP